jgi:hypothetical protein
MAGKVTSIQDTEEGNHTCALASQTHHSTMHPPSVFVNISFSLGSSQKLLRKNGKQEVQGACEDSQVTRPYLLSAEA